ncbi:MAG: hypothetical protein AAGA68_27430 [Pseudomonadota bacterium]
MTSQPTVKLPGYWGPVLAVVAALGAGGYGGSYLTSHPQQDGGNEVRDELAEANARLLAQDARLEEMQRALTRIEEELRSQRQQIGDLREKVAGMEGS